MTKETKELFSRLKSELTYYHNPTADVSDITKAVTELEAKVKEMEVYLTKGGIILDRNGKQCHVGDKVAWYHPLSDNRYYIFRGKLEFSTESNQLHIHACGGMFNPISENFELKVIIPSKAHCGIFSKSLG